MRQRLDLVNHGTSDVDQTLQNLANELGKKEEEILKLRWLTQDLAAERNGLERKIQNSTKDAAFVSITPQRQMEYAVDFSKFMDDDADEISDDPAENGMLSLEMASDTEIDPEVLCCRDIWSVFQPYFFILMVLFK